ncbi:hypothetical protein GIB67_026514 [Kingdonia uniflora]|uniref:Uncharacterized protein n=1 Tax=Kingdonia uniflora TaxID=39325 RepID=A0A7J7PBM0_9MAGN|nr:hypothetical protein GIB67_026514 [Kingdonia uniflora]
MIWTRLPNMTEVLLFFFPVPRFGYRSHDRGCHHWICATSSVLVLRVLWGWSPYSQGRGRYHIDHRTIETITWESWFDSAVSKTEDILNTKLISRKRIPLQVPNGNCEYYLGDRCWRQVTGVVRIPLDPPLNMSPHINLVALHGMRQAGAGITPVVVASASVHSLSQDFSLPGEAEEPDLGWHMEWTRQRERLPIARLRDPLPMSSSYDAEELWHLTHGMR